jgi:hypothetical protein
MMTIVVMAIVVMAIVVMAIVVVVVVVILILLLRPLHCCAATSDACFHWAPSPNLR